MLDEIIAKKSLQANATIGFYKANTVDDDSIEIYENGKIKTTFHNLRQQGRKAENLPNLIAE
jgi:5-methyltetrahydrofolate--homocysteine methyltransferase